ncbi:TOMM precursor leader peptide-binding protein [Thermobispora bispora]|uniref:YcaO domain-containing protein n=1 Tax=Thermobispora bispora (strain ATCC 19993 / DSM 43833 / CBS 139.67 / JCM 10125 / KCTC 9307 / NBRC 14880 / R51) TaxID=469371 RepID=D6Y507_THEBD|nr:TOMM precursor leader peptide-binding protein [Thermobispora bispora]ADG87282.1 protein of unknown function DUF181 [Thermobispora bispora DSM 43833]
MSDALAAAIIGAGLLADELAAAFRPYGEVIRLDEVERAETEAHRLRALVMACDGWDTSIYRETRERCRRLGIPWLPVRTEHGIAVIGPLERPGEPGCAHCFELRRERARPDAAAYRAILNHHGPELAKRPSPYLDELAAATIAALGVRMIDQGSGCHVWYVRLNGLTVERHAFLPEPLCPECGSLPMDDRDSAVIVLRSQPKRAPDDYRTRDIVDELDALVADYVDGESGLIRPLVRDTQGGLVIAGAMLPLRFAGGSEPGVGRTRGYRTSEVTAILEALERWGGVEPGGKRTVIRAAFRDIAADALDPRTLGVHSPEAYAAEDFPFRPFTEDEETEWVWGYSFARRSPILVPETVAYYYVHRDRPRQERPFLYEISNGCALGSGMEEAILYGILEVVERDAFLMTWYGRLGVPRIDLDSAKNRMVPLQAAAISAETGYRIEVYDTTMEHGIPSVWALAIRGGEEPTAAPRPRMVCAAAAHLDPEQAVLSALSELGPLLADLLRRYPDEAERARRMVDDPGLVTTMHDHSTLYGADEAFGRLEFLTGTASTRDLAAMRESTVAFRSADLRDDLLEVIGRILAEGMDVIVVDQTTPEHRVHGFTCVKVLIPGMIPMTFGHRNRRLDGLTRPLVIPYRLGYRPAPLTPEALNPHPHPFP